MVLDGLRGDEEAAADLLVGEPVDHLPSDLELAVAEGTDPRRLVRDPPRKPAAELTGEAERGLGDRLVLGLERNRPREERGLEHTAGVEQAPADPFEVGEVDRCGLGREAPRLARRDVGWGEIEARCQAGDVASVSNTGS